MDRGYGRIAAAQGEPLRNNHPVQPSPIARNRTVVSQFVKFAAVGLSNTALSLAIYTLLLKAFDVNYLAASAIAFICGAINGYLWNGRFTFRGHRGGSLAPLRWTVVQGFGLAINEGLVYAWVHGLGAGKLSGQVFATAIVVCLTFALNRTWTFRMTVAQPL